MKRRLVFCLEGFSIPLQPLDQWHGLLARSQPKRLEDWVEVSEPMAPRWSRAILGAFRYHHEPWAGLVVLAYLYPEYQLLVQLPEFVRNQVITPIVLVYITVEGFLIALSPQMKNKLYRDLFAVAVGVPAILASVYTFSIATFQSVQGNVLSTNVVTLAFQGDSILFLLLVELYALGLLVPPKVHKAGLTRVDPAETPVDTEP